MSSTLSSLIQMTLAIALFLLASSMANASDRPEPVPVNQDCAEQRVT